MAWSNSATAYRDGAVKSSFWIRTSTLNDCGLPTALASAAKSETNFYNTGTKTLDPANTTTAANFMLIQGRFCEEGHGFEKTTGDTYSDGIGRTRIQNMNVNFDATFDNVTSDNAEYLIDTFHNQMCDVIEFDCSVGSTEGESFDIGYGLIISVEQLSKNNDLRKIRIRGLTTKESTPDSVFLTDKILAAV